MTSEKIELYEIPDLMKGMFLSRPNRFVAEIEYKGVIEVAHVHDPGRLKELLVPGVEVLFTKSKGKLKYYIRAVKHEQKWVLIDTAQHSRIAKLIFGLMTEFKQAKEIKSEVKVGKSRIDFSLDGTPLEVKGVTLVRDAIALFPDAPTERGARHVGEIIEHDGIILFLVFRDAKEFVPNEHMDPKFSTQLKKARKQGIQIICARISFDGASLYYEGRMPLGKF